MLSITWILDSKCADDAIPRGATDSRGLSIPLKGCGDGGVNLFSVRFSDRSMGKDISISNPEQASSGGVAVPRLSVFDNALNKML